MGGKSKKSKSAQNSDVSNPKPRTDVDSVKHIYKRLRKGLDLKTLGKEAENLERIKPSAVTRLCRAKVELCQTAESMQDRSLFELSTKPYPTEPSFETLRDQILHVIELTREGATVYSSLLCAVLCVKLARVMGHRPENFNLPRTAEEYLDPNSEIIEQEKDLCEFEKWDKKKAPDVRNQKVALLVAIQREQKLSGQDSTSAHDIPTLAHGLITAGVLLTHQRSALADLMTFRQKRENNLASAVNNMQFDQLLASPGFNNLALENSKSAPDDSESAKRKNEEHKKRGGHKQPDSDADAVEKTAQEVLAYVTAKMANLQDNDARLAALQELSSVPLAEIPTLFMGQPEDERPKEVAGLRYLVPQEGSMVTSCLVVMDDDNETGLPYPAAVDSVKQQMLERLDQDASRYGDTGRHQEGLDMIRVAEQAFVGWGVWPGQAPSSLVPLQDLAEFEEHMQSATSEPALVPLNEPSTQFCEAVSAVLYDRLRDRTMGVDNSTVDRTVKMQLRQLLASGGSAERPILGKLKDAALVQMNALLFEPHAKTMLETGMADLGGLDNALWMHLSISEVGHLADKDMEQMAIRKGQLAVTLAELNEKADQDLDVVACLKTLDKAVTLWQSTEPFVSRLMSKLDKHNVTVEGEANDYLYSNNATEVELNGLPGRSSNGFESPISAWWANAGLRLTDSEMRTAALEEMVLAVRVLIGGQHFTTGVASALCAHIQQTLHPGNERLPNMNIYLEHAQFLPLPSMRELLDFLWLQIGLRFHFLPLVENVRQRLLQSDDDRWWEVHPDGLLKWSQPYLQEMWKAALYQPLNQQDAEKQDVEKQDAEKQDADNQDAEQVPIEENPAGDIKLSDELLLKLHQKPLVVEEGFLKQLVAGVYNQNEEHGPCDGMTREEADARDEDLCVLHDAVAMNTLREAVDAVMTLAKHCAQLVQARDAASLQPQLPLLVDETDVQAATSELYDPVLTKQALAACESSTDAHITLCDMRLAAARLEFAQRTSEFDQYVQLQKAVASHLHIMIGYMGGMQGYQIMGMLKMPELYDRHLWRVGDVINKRLSEVGALKEVAKGEVSHHEKARNDAERKLRPDKKTLLYELLGFCQGPRGLPIQDLLGDNQRILANLVSPAADEIAAVQLRLDSLALQIQHSSRDAARLKCSSMYDLLLYGQNNLLAKKLAEEAKKHKERISKEAAEKNMQELLAAEVKTQAVTEGPKKGKKKKKAAAKLREGKVEVEEQPSLSEAAEEPTEEPGFFADNADGSLEPPEVSIIDTGSPPMVSDANGFGDYQIQLRDGSQEEDWSTVDKKRKAKPGFKQDGASESGGLEASTSGVAASVEVDPDGWEAHDLVTADMPQQNSDEDAWSKVDNKKGAKAKGESQPSHGAPDSARAGMPAAQGSWEDEDEFQDAASSVSDSFGSSNPPASSRSASAVNRQSGKQANQQNRQILKSPGKQSAMSGDADTQCDRCGKYGHIRANCEELFCDHCRIPGHNIAHCDKHKEKLSKQSGQNQASAKEGQRPAGRQNQSAARQDLQSGRETQTAESDQQTRPQPPPFYRGECFWCFVTGHRKLDCPALPNSKFFDPEAKRALDARKAKDARRFNERPGQPPAPPRQQDSIPAPNQPVGRPSTNSGAQRSSGKPERTSGNSMGSRQGHDPDSSQPTRPLPAKPSRHASRAGSVQQTESDFPSLQPANAHMPPGVPMPGAPDPQSRHMSQPPPPAWGPAVKSNASQASMQSRGNRHQQHSANAQSAGPPQAGFDHSQQAAQSHSTVNGRQPNHEHMQGPPMHNHPPGRGSAPGPYPDPSQNGSFPQFDQGMPGQWPNPGQPAFPNPVNPAMLPGASNLHVVAPGDQLSAQFDPVVSPHFVQRGAVASAIPFSYQPQQQQQQSDYNPSAPLAEFAQELRHTAPAPAAADEDLNDEDYLQNILGENADDNALGHQSEILPPAGTAWQNPNSRVFEADEDDEDDYQRGIQESLLSQQNAAALQQQQLEMYNSNRVQTSTSSNGASAGGAGLRNATGEYNCFLNVIIQCLWRCQAFRKQITQWNYAVYQDNDIVAALMDLFQALNEKEQQQVGGAVDPNPLREALSSFMDFVTGQMHDASEVLSALYENLTKVAKANAQPHLLDRIFGLDVQEAVHCEDCNKDTHVHQYTQYFFNVIAAAVPAIRQVVGEQELGFTLRAIEEQTLKSCDSDKGGCGKMRSVQHSLNSMAPKVFTMQLAWQSANETREDIAHTLGGLREELDLSQVYEGLEAGKYVYRIRSMVCYYGQHYMAVALMADQNWYMFDDATVVLIGQWSDVVTKCVAGRTQPSVLFFEGV